MTCHVQLCKQAESANSVRIVVTGLHVSRFQVPQYMISSISGCAHSLLLKHDGQAVTCCTCMLTGFCVMLLHETVMYAMLKHTACTHTLLLTGPELVIDKNVFGHCLPAGAAPGQQGLANALQLAGQQIMHPTLLQVQCMAMAGLVLHGPSWVSCFSPHVCRKRLQEETRMVQPEVVVCLGEVAMLEVGDVGKGEGLHLTC